MVKPTVTSIQGRGPPLVMAQPRAKAPAIDTSAMSCCVVSLRTSIPDSWPVLSADAPPDCASQTSTDAPAVCGLAR